MLDSETIVMAEIVDNETGKVLTGEVQEPESVIDDQPPPPDKEPNPTDEKPSANEVEAYPFWSQTGKPEINPMNLVEFAQSQGFGNLQTAASRTAKSTLFRNGDGILQYHNAKTFRKFLQTYVQANEKDPEQKDARNAVLTKLVTLPSSSLNNWLESLPSWSETGFADTEKLDLYNDDKNNCYLPFKNGVVHITKDKIELLDKDVLKSKGCIWESKIIPKPIAIDEHYHASGSRPPGNVFKDFIHHALKDNVKPKNPSEGETNDYEAGTEEASYRGRKDAFETAFGYLIHSYNPPDDAKAIVFIDVDSSPERTDGGNGKSVAMAMIKCYRETAFVDGKLKWSHLFGQVCGLAKM